MISEIFEPNVKISEKYTLKFSFIPNLEHKELKGIRVFFNESNYKQALNLKIKINLKQRIIV